MTGTYIDTYGRVINYGVHKKKLRIDRLILQGCMAGIFVGLAGHACSAIAGGYSTDPNFPLAVAKSTQTLIYASIFPVAFISIILTGAELFTGNTMTMLICLFHKKVTLTDLLFNWVFSLLSNLVGTVLVAYFVSFLTDTFAQGTFHKFIVDNAEKKLAYGWGSTFIRGIGANTFVCLALWQVIAVDDVAGKVLVLWFPVVAFCIAGFEHIVANFYTILVGAMYGANIGIGEIIYKNFLPTLLGNIVGGCVVVGIVYWYNCHDSWDEMEKLDAPELAREASMSLGMARQPSQTPFMRKVSSAMRASSERNQIVVFPPVQEDENEAELEHIAQKST